jgi:hypothetical protein
MDRFLSMMFASMVVAGSILCAAQGPDVASKSVVSAPAMAPSSSSANPSSATPAVVTPTGITPVTPDDAETAMDPASLLPDLPALPRTRASLIGGTIQKVDRIRDQVTIQIFGGGKMKVFFDPRTQLLAGNTQGSALDLRPGDHVYIDTILEGSTIFARDIRLASHVTGGTSQGVVISYRAGDSELVLRDRLSPEPVKLHFTPRTQIVQDGHAAFASQLVPGTLVDVNFVAQKNNREVQQVSILAVPGTDFTFAGQVASLDLHLGLLVIVSANDHKTYEIYLDPSVVPVDDRLHIGADVSSVANFDGKRYVARSLIVNSK